MIKRTVIPLAAAVTALVVISVVACGGSAKPEKPKRPILTENQMPDQILEPKIFPLFTDLYKGGLKIDVDSKVYIWNGCRMTLMTNEDYYEPTDYWKITVNPGSDWFGWGIHHFPSGSRNLSGFEEGYLHFAMRSTSKSTPVKIGIKSGYMYESWIALTNGLYGFEYDDQWHVINIPFKEFLPRIKFGAINAFFMFSQQVSPVKFGSVYYVDQLAYVKTTNTEVQNIDAEAIVSNENANAQ